MSIAVALDANMPPSGRGIYANGGSTYDLSYLSRYDFVVLNIRRGDAVGLARALVAAGKTVYAYDYGSGWLPGDDFAATISRYEAFCDQTGAAGGIADVEAGWPGAPTPDAQALAQAISDSIGRGYRWGVTSYPEGLPWCLPAIKAGAWGSPQMYGQSGATAEWYSRWATACGTKIVPSVALWPGNASLGMPDFANAANYATYLASLPLARGAIAWPAGIPSASMQSAFDAWEPWRSVAPRVLLWVQAWASTPLGIVAIVLAVLAVVYAIYQR